MILYPFNPLIMKSFHGAWHNLNGHVISLYMMIHDYIAQQFQEEFLYFRTLSGSRNIITGKFIILCMKVCKATIFPVSSMTQRCLDLIVSLELDRHGNCTLLLWLQDHEPGISHSHVTPTILLSGLSKKRYWLVIYCQKSCHFQTFTSEYTIIIFSLESYALDLLFKKVFTVWNSYSLALLYYHAISLPDL